MNVALCTSFGAQRHVHTHPSAALPPGPPRRPRPPPRRPGLPSRRLASRPGRRCAGPTCNSAPANPSTLGSL